MSIDAKVQKVEVELDDSGVLHLVDRPPDGCAGQPRLYFDSCPKNTYKLEGLNIWGGSDSIMLGSKEIATRKGYTSIIFHKDDILDAAITAYKFPGEGGS